MKQLSITLLLFAGAFGLFGCGGNTSSPEHAAKAFMEHLKSGDFEAAKAYATDETKEMLGMLEGFKAMADDEWEEEFEDMDEFEVTNVEVDGDEAKVTFCCFEENEEERVKLKQVEGEWKVHFDKEDAQKENGSDAREDAGEDWEAEEAAPVDEGEDTDD